MRTLMSAVAMVGSLVLGRVACAQDAAKAPAVVVAVIEPHAKGSEQGELDFSVILGELKLTNTDAVLEGLARPAEGRLTLQSQPLAILIRYDVPTGTLATVASFATKVGYSPDQIVVFLFDAERRSMMQVTPSLRNAPFSTDPDVISSYVNRQ